MRCAWGVAAAVGIAGSASGQSNATFLIEVSNVVTPSSPEATVEVWGIWEDLGPPMSNMSHVFIGADYDLVADEGEFTSAIIDLVFTGNTAGSPMGNRVTGAALGQLHLPLVANAVFDNPILLAHYTWQTTDFRTRRVGLVTEGTSDIRVAGFISLLPISLISTFTPGSGRIEVVPAGGSVPLLVLGCVAAAHRGRGGR